MNIFPIKEPLLMKSVPDNGEGRMYSTECSIAIGVNVYPEQNRIEFIPRLIRKDNTLAMELHEAKLDVREDRFFQSGIEVKDPEIYAEAKKSIMKLSDPILEQIRYGKIGDEILGNYI